MRSDGKRRTLVQGGFAAEGVARGAWFSRRLYNPNLSEETREQEHLRPMKTATQVIFRHITSADFFNIYKPPQATSGGGGQSYIDFPMRAVPAKAWRTFFGRRQPKGTKTGPMWEAEFHSLGLGDSQLVQIGQRRRQSFNIRLQKTSSNRGNRVYAWDPTFSDFPKPANPARHYAVKNLVIYLVKTAEGELWAGWFRAKSPKRSWKCDPRLTEMFEEPREGAAGSILLNPPIAMNENDSEWPFRRTTRGTGRRTARARLRKQKRLDASQLRREEHDENALLEELFTEDKSSLTERSPRRARVARQVLRRNARIVRKLKELYQGKCQISGTRWTFKKADGQYYSEAHHLVHLGKGGADLPQNIIIVSPLIHRMLHHAVLSEIRLQEIKDNRLKIRIGRRRYVIKWHPRHASVVLSGSARK